MFLLFSEPSTSFGDTSGFDDGVRRRNIPSFEGPRSRTSDEDDEDEEVEFKLPVKEEKPWLSMNKCIVGALILLFLGSLFLSGEFLLRLTKLAIVFLLLWSDKGKVATVSTIKRHDYDIYNTISEPIGFHLNTK